MSNFTNNGKKKKEDVLQAVLFVDLFGKSIFGPESPVVQPGLVPLANRKLVDYALEALTLSGFHEVFLYCTCELEALKNHLASSRWAHLSTADTIIEIIYSEDTHSLGDAMRHLDANGMIRGDFILMTTGIITNVHLQELLEVHRATVKADKGAVMTLVHRRSEQEPKDTNEPILVSDDETGKIISFNEKKREPKIHFDRLRPEFTVHLDRYDTGIAVCSASVLPSFTDNFDFSEMFDFVKEILVNEEISGNSVYLHRLDKGYANRVVDFESYKEVSNDVLHRWSFPVVPDIPLGSAPLDSDYVLGLNFIYRAKQANVARSAILGSTVIIGCSTQIKQNSRISESSIGENCSIGANVTIFRSQIGSNVIIEDNCHLEDCVISDNCKLVQQTRLKPYSLLLENEVYNIKRHDQEYEDSDDDSDRDSNGPHNDVELQEGHQEKDFNSFCSELLETLAHGYAENVSTENLVLEIHGIRTANYIFFEQVTGAVMKGIVSIPTKVVPNFMQLSIKDQWEKTKGIVVKYKELLANYVKNNVAQKNALNALEEYANDNKYFRPMLMQVLKYLYDEDLLSEDSILLWYNTASLYDTAKEIRLMVSKFIDWLQEASEASDSEEEDDED